MIKETVDSVRVAEQEATDTVTAAQEEAQKRKAEIKSKAEAFRKESLEKAEEEARILMEETVNKCNDYQKQREQEIERKVAKLNSIAADRMGGAAAAVTDALV